VPARTSSQFSERAALICLGAQVQPTSRDDVSGPALSHAPPAEEDSALHAGRDVEEVRFSLLVSTRTVATLLNLLHSPCVGVPALPTRTAAGTRKAQDAAPVAS
jgi:hypothetical protein